MLLLQPAWKCYSFPTSNTVGRIRSYDDVSCGDLRIPFIPPIKLTARGQVIHSGLCNQPPISMIIKTIKTRRAPPRKPFWFDGIVRVYTPVKRSWQDPEWLKALDSVAAVRANP